ncbi:hypothetical protein GJ496_003036 [Pomphorhynchus laevis]|nr:hypothetical protein GJ496_003036 [Pomphorhynchus laevis]
MDNLFSNIEKEQQAKISKDISVLVHSWLQISGSKLQKSKELGLTASSFEENHSERICYSQVDEDDQSICDMPRLNILDSISDEWKLLANGILKEMVYTQNYPTREIIGHKEQMNTIKKLTFLPVTIPQKWKNLLNQSGIVLLYGPSGTGKTTVVRSLATSFQATLFYASASNLISKWRGESEKIVKILFWLADRLSPSIIFIDEVDSFLSQRLSNSCEKDYTRSLKTELFVNMDLIKLSNNGVFLFSASNLPW